MDGSMYYTLLGHGASEEPYNLFVVEETTGQVRIFDVLDREERASYILTGVARFRNGTVAERIELMIEVEDENDNPPVFVPVPAARVIESSPAENPDSDILAEVIGIYSATDEDSGKPAENVQYAKDVPSKTATGTIAIHVADANNNCPTLTKNLEDICSNTQVVIVTATDNDAEPNGGPFLFSIVPKETTGLWGLEPHTGIWYRFGYRNGAVTRMVPDRRASHSPDSHFASDMPLVCDYEGKGSSVGSVGCCFSLPEFDNDLKFLDDLDWKFKTLAGMCLPEPLHPPNPHKTVLTHITGQLKAESRQVQHRAARPEVKELKTVNTNNDIITNSNSTNFTQSSTDNTCYITTSSTVKSADCNITSSTVKHINSNSTYFRKSSAVYPSCASSTLKSTSKTAPPPGPRAAVSMAVLPSANQLVMVQQQPIFYSTTSIPVACFIQPQIQCNALLAKGPTDGSLPSVALFNSNHQHMEYISGGRQAAGGIDFAQSNCKENRWTQGQIKQPKA
ncbi:unnamed protein product [Boreogadus saida]